MAPARVTVSQHDHYTSTVYAGRHEYQTDEPVDFGGADKGPTPWELVLSGMGSCTVITIEMYAQRKGWKVQGVEVDLSRDDTSGEIEMHVDIVGSELDDAQRERLMQVAQKCPVVRAIASGSEVTKSVHVHLREAHQA